MTDHEVKAPLEYELPQVPSEYEEEDVCRVCRVEGDEEMPLIYPCKCSGSVRYVHPDCLKRWLATSGKRACEICDHKYVFTKVYSDYIPSTIPFEVVLKQVTRFILRILYRIARVYLASNAWLLLLPSANLYSLRCLLWAVDVASPRARSTGVQPVANATLSANSTIANSTQITGYNETRIAVHEIINHPLRTMGTIVQDSWQRWNAGEDHTIFGYIFRGQLLTIALAGLIISIILIREWMTQHHWEHGNTGSENEEGPIDPSEWTIQGGIAYRNQTSRPVSTTEKPEEEAKRKSSLHEFLDEGNGDGDDEGEWEDEEPSDSAVAAVAEPSRSSPQGPLHDDASQPPLSSPLPTESQAGPSEQPARPCNADKEGFEKEVSYAAPELIGQRSAKGKERETAGSGTDAAAAAAASTDRSGHTGISADRPDSSTLSVHGPLDQTSRNQSFSTLPSQSEGHSDGDTPSPRPDVAELPEDALPVPEPMILRNNDVPAPEELIEALQAGNNNPPIMDPPVVFDDPDDAPMELDDWEGILEVAGLIGPIQNLIQNVMFGFMIMGASMTLLVGGPMWIGRLFLAVDYVRTSIYLTTLVFKGTRLVLDPALRVTYDIAKEVVFLPLLSSLGAFEKIVADSAGLGRSSSSPQVNWFDRVASSTFGEQVGRRLGDFFAVIGHTAYEQAVSLYAANRQWSDRTLGSATLASRMSTVAVGYGAIAAFMVLLALNPAESSSAMASSIGQSIRRHSQFVKLALFMFIELAIFPVGIGAIIILCTSPLIGEFDFSQATSIVYRVPFGAVFACWIIGTTFMFWFAALLQSVRKLFRKGVLFFIRDPNERSYNPVKEILERPTSSQLRKLSISAIMYTFVVIHLLGIWCWVLGRSPLRHQLRVLPLRLQGYDALSTAPFDYLMLTLISSPSVTKLYPAVFVRRGIERWWRDVISRYTLDSLLSYDSSVKPESAVASRIWAVLDAVDQVLLGRYHNAQTRARVPASDGLVLLKPEQRRGRGVFVRLDENGCPTTAEDKMLLLLQDKAAREKNRDPTKDYTVVWLPRYWRTRVHALIMTALVAAGSTACAILIGPLVTGRLALDTVLSSPAHDGYNWFAGACILLSLIWIGTAVKKYIIASQRANRIRASTFATRAKRTIAYWLRAMASLSIMFVLLPILLGVAYELFFAMPLRYGLKPATPVLHLWEAWSMGLVLTFAYAAYMRDADHAIPRRARRGGEAWRIRALYRNLRPDKLGAVWHCTWRLMLRLVIGIISPPVFSLMASLIPVPQEHQIAISVVYRLNYPFCLATFALYRYRHALWRGYQTLRQDLIDAEYVVEERVENYDTSTTEHERKPSMVVRDSEQNEVVVRDAEEAVAGDDGDGDGEWEDVDG